MKVITFTVENPTPDMFAKIYAITNGTSQVVDVKETNDGLAPLAAAAKKKGKKAAPTPPAKTVSKDEDEDFGKEELDEEDLDDTTGGDDPANFDDEDEDEDAIDFSEVKAAINKYGVKNEEDMLAIFSSVNVKSTKELEKFPKKWEAVLRKVNAKLSAKKARA